MKILFVVSHYYPYTDGVEYVVKSVAERLVKKGHDVRVLCGEQGVNKPIEEVVNGVFVIRWPVKAPGDAYHIPRMRDNLRRWLIESVKNYDVIHFHSIHSVFSLSILRNTSVLKVLTPYYHGTGHTLFRRILWRGWRQYVKKLLRYVDVIHTVSKLEAQLVKKISR